MRRILSICAVLLWCGPAMAQLPLTGAGKGAPGGYTGPGDIQTFLVWGSVARVYTAAQASPSTNMAILVASGNGTSICTLRGSTAGIADLTNTYCTQPVACSGGCTPAAACAAANGGSCRASTLYDQVGGNNWVNASLTQMPLVAFNDLNGLPALVYAHTNNQYLVSQSTITHTQALTIVAVANHTSTDSVNIMGISGGDIELLVTNGNVGIYAGAGPLTTTAANNSYHVIQGQANGASPNSAILVDGAAAVTGSAGTNNISGGNVGYGSYGTNTLGFTGNITEAGVFAGTTSATLQTNMRTQYGL